jgi:hypothetical protein
MTAPTPQDSTTDAQDALPAWTVRYTWLVPDGSVHAPYTYVQRDSEDNAVDHAVATLDSQPRWEMLRVECAHVLMPSGEWRKVDWSA